MTWSKVSFTFTMTHKVPSLIVISDAYNTVINEMKSQITRANNNLPMLITVEISFTMTSAHD